MKFRCLRGIYLHAESGYTNILSSDEIKFPALELSDHLGKLLEPQSLDISVNVKYAFLYPAAMNGVNYVMTGIGESVKTLQAARRESGVKVPYVQYYLIKASDFGKEITPPFKLAMDYYVSYAKAFNMRSNELESVELDQLGSKEPPPYEHKSAIDSLLDAFLEKTKVTSRITSYDEGVRIVHVLLARTLGMHRWAHRILITPVEGLFQGSLILVYGSSDLNLTRFSLERKGKGYPSWVDERALGSFKDKIARQSGFSNFEEYIDRNKPNESAEAINSFLRAYANRDSVQLALNEQKQCVTQILDKLKIGPAGAEEIIQAFEEERKFQELRQNASLLGLRTDDIPFDAEMKGVIEGSPLPIIRVLSKKRELSENARSWINIRLEAMNEQIKEWWESGEFTVPGDILSAYGGAEIIGEGTRILQDRFEREKDYYSLLEPIILLPAKGLAVIDSLRKSGNNEWCGLLGPLYESVIVSFETLKRRVKANEFGIDPFTIPTQRIAREALESLTKALQTLNERNSACDKKLRRDFSILSKLYREILKLTLSLEERSLRERGKVLLEALD